MTPACLPAPERTTNQDPATGDHLRREHDMDATTSSSGTITCAKPACGALTTAAESVYIDGCGQVCTGCAGPVPAWLLDIEPPF
jgi:hypothetical protein